MITPLATIVGLTLSAARPAFAQVEPPPALAAAAWGGRVSALGGVDAWTGGEGLAGGSLRGFGWTNLTWDRLELSASYAGALTLAPGHTVRAFDGHGADLRLGRAGPRPHAAWLGVQAGFLGAAPWQEALAGAQWAARGQSGWLSVLGAAGARLGTTDHPTGLLALTAAYSRAGWMAGARADLRWIGGGASSLAPLLQVWGREAVGASLWLDQRVGVGAVRGPVDRALPGLPLSGAAWLDARAGAEWAGPGGWALRGELGGELGLADTRYRRGQVYVGLVYRAQATQRRPAWWVGEDGLRLFYFDPNAQAVELLGDFTGWEAVPLREAGAGWWVVELPVDSGEHEYVYRVDGALRTPPEAERLREDGFGGVNGVLTVP